MTLVQTEPKSIKIGTTDIKRITIRPNGTEKQIRHKTIPMNGLLGYRPLQTDLLDASGNGKDGSWYSGTGSFGTVGGKTGARVTSTGGTGLTTQHIVTTLNYQTSPFTIIGWVAFNTMDSSNRHGMMTSSSSNSNGVTIGTRPADNLYPTFYINGGATVRVTNSAPSINTWYCWCGTRDGSTMKTYFNGNYYDSGSAASINAGGVRRLGCAMRNSGDAVNSGTDGWVRHCAVWNRVLSAEEAQEFYTLTS